VKILYILDSLNRGGAEMLALDLCRNAQSNGLDLTFVATGGGDLEKEFQQSGTRFIRLQRRLPIDIYLIKELRKIIEEEQIQLVHSNQAVEALHLYYAIHGRDVKQVMTFHLCEADIKSRLALKFLVPRMDANIAVSQDLLRSLQKSWDIKKNFHLLYNGVDCKRLEPVKGQVLREELNLSNDQFLLGMVGNFYLDERKDQLTVCKALSIVCSVVPNLHFVFVGGRSEGGSKVYSDCINYCYEHNLEKRVHFLGKRSDIADVLSSLDLFVFSSTKDSFGIAAVEAMMMGIPTIVSDIGPLLEVSNNGLYASVFRKRDPQDLANRMLMLIKDSSERLRLGINGKRWAMEQFSIETFISNSIKLYSQLFNNDISTNSYTDANE
jgi:L-malate glycosyltransferase